MVTTTYVNRPVKFQKIIISRYNIHNDKNVAQLREAMCIDEIKNDVVFSSDVKNQEIFDLIRQCEPEI